MAPATGWTPATRGAVRDELCRRLGCDAETLAAALLARLTAGKALDLALGLGHAPDFDEAYFADGFGGVGLLADTLQAWFAECWWKAGGWAWPIPLWLHVHDGFGDGRGIALTERC